jgi:dTDP-4-dehydrorhamnose 3,5-epimerase
VREPQDTAIDGVLLLPLLTHPDHRGAVTEIFRRSWIPGIREMVQSNLSVSKAGVLRGLHFHRRQADQWCLVSGRAVVGLFDLRAGSPTEGTPAALELSGDGDHAALYIPAGVAHGFYAMTDLVLLYLVDRYYSGEDEFGVAWDDPGLGISWPDPTPILSDRDRSNPSLAQVLRDPPPYGG